MGAISFSIDQKLVQLLQEELPLQVFVESGTFQGDTVASMMSLFQELHSIELSEELFQQAQQRFEDSSKVHLHQGASPDALNALLPQLGEQPVLFWLDAHWCESQGTAGSLSQCPLLEELESIGKLNAQSVVLIDDARYFLAPPPPPHECSQWPRWHQVTEGLLALSDQHEITVINDVVAFYPTAARPAIESFAAQHGVDWLAMIDLAKNFPELQQGVEAKDREIERLSHCDAELRRACEAKDLEIERLNRCDTELRNACEAMERELQRLRNA